MNGLKFSVSILFIILACCVSMLGDAQHVHAEDTLPEIRRISFASRADGEGIVIRLHATGTVNAFSEPRLVDAKRIELVVFNAELSRAYKTDTPYDPISDFGVEAKKGHLLFTFTLDEDVTVKTAAYPDQQSNDILVGITLLEDRRSAIVAEADIVNEVEEPEVAEVKAIAPAPVDTSPSERTQGGSPQTRTNQANTTPVRQASHNGTSGEKWVLDTVVIDAGHGGHDSGAVHNGIREKDINLDVAMKLGYYLERFLKVKVVYTRTDDSFVDLQERGHIANEAGAKLFISIHANAAPYSRSVKGTETYILGLHRSEKAREVMERENSVVSLEDNPDQYDSFYQNSIIRTLALSANLKLSERLAGHIEHQFSNRARRTSRGVKQAGLIVLWAASMPAVLVELGYLTNRFEAAYLNSEQGQDYLASAIYRAVRDFKNEYEKGLEISASN